MRINVDIVDAHHREAVAIVHRGDDRQEVVIEIDDETLWLWSEGFEGAAIARIEQRVRDAAKGAN